MDDDLTAFFLGVVVGIVIIVLIRGFNGQFDADNELGQSICDQEYGMDYKDYNNKELECKPKITANQTIYDGITIKILK